MNKKLIGLLGLFVIFSIVLSPVVALGQPAHAPTDISLTPTQMTPPNVEPLGVFSKVITWLFGLLLVIVVILVLVAAYMFATGGGNPDQLGKAKNLLMYALVGLAIAVLARGIMAFVLKILW